MRHWKGTSAYWLSSTRMRIAKQKLLSSPQVGYIELFARVQRTNALAVHLADFHVGLADLFCAERHVAYTIPDSGLFNVVGRGSVLEDPEVSLWLHEGFTRRLVEWLSHLRWYPDSGGAWTAISAPTPSQGFLESAAHTPFQLRPAAWLPAPWLSDIINLPAVSEAPSVAMSGTKNIDTSGVKNAATSEAVAGSAATRGAAAGNAATIGNVGTTSILDDAGDMVVGKQA